MPRWFSNLIEANRLGAFTFFVVIAHATEVGLFAFLAELSSHFSTFLLCLTTSEDFADYGGLPHPRVRFIPSCMFWPDGARNVSRFMSRHPTPRLRATSRTLSNVLLFQT